MAQKKASSRRMFLEQAGLAAAGVATAQAGLLSRFAKQAANIPAGVSRTVLQPVDYGAVRFASGVAEQQRERTVAILLALTDDELLKPFRLRSGKAAPGNSIGGWYDAHAYCPGHTFGQWLSAFCRTYAIKPSDAMQTRIRGLVGGLGESFDITGKFFGGDNRFPAYTLEKLNCGLVDAISLAQIAEAPAVLRQVNQLAQPYLPEKALSRAEQRKRTTRDVSYTYDESYTLPENYFLAFQRTGDPYYRELALKFMHTSFLDPLAAGENVLPGLHAYSHLNTFNSAAQAYLVDGNETALAAAIQGFEFVEQQSFASGGWGPNEAFITPGKGQLAASLRNTHSSFETPCGAYGHFKITRSLLSITGDGRYGDSMEAVMLNTILGSLPLQPDGTSFYYSDYNMHASKVYHDTKWPCCSGTLAQASADYRINTYLLSPRGIHVNQYTASTVHFEDHGVAISMEQWGHYPLHEDIHFRVQPSRSAVFTVAFRIPAWAGTGARLSINGRTTTLPSPVKGFSAIQRRWHRDDRMTLTIPLPLRLQAIDSETPGTVALLRGPVLLYGIGNALTTTESALLAATQLGPGEWSVRTPAGDRRFTTFDRIADGNYSAYHQLA
jgi:DUF1680 family protein